MQSLAWAGSAGDAASPTLQRRTLLTLLSLGEAAHALLNIIGWIGPPAQLQCADDAAVECQEGDVQRRALWNCNHEGFKSK